MKTANQARDLAKAANTADLTKVYQAIETYAKKGDYRMHIYYALTTEQKSELTDNGFKVTDLTERNETCIEISWLPISATESIASAIENSEPKDGFIPKYDPKWKK